jgi:transcriptional regulator with PAS, ATPase and Fis domain
MCWKHILLDIRVIAATNRDLKQAMAEKSSERIFITA